MTRFGMLIDTKKCVGCLSCLTACQRQNNLNAHQMFIRFEQQEVGVFPQVRIETVPLQCMHCSDAPCVAVCPTGAAYKGADGIVGVDTGRCIGCKYCMSACPYQVRVHDPESGTVGKCRFCTASAQTTGTQMCSCVEACLSGARMFGDLDDANSDISKAIVSLGAHPIAGDLTEANVFYVR